MQFLLITVTDSTSGRAHDELQALLASIGSNCAIGDVIVVMRGGRTFQPTAPHGFNLHTLDAPLQISISSARNLALQFAAQRNMLAEETVVSFPDDDCKYPATLLTSVKACLGDEVMVVAGVYGPSAQQIDRKRFPSGTRPLTPSLAVHSCASVTTFLRASVVNAVGLLDERFGVGAKFGCAEDADYLLRALLTGHRCVYDGDNLLVLHPYKTGNRAKYYYGSVAVLAKHARSFHRLAGSLAIELRAGPRLVLKRKLTLAVYLRVLGSAAVLLVRGSGSQRGL